jgi:hypothetical protein
MKKASTLLFVVIATLLSLSLSAAPQFKIEQIEGAWWSDPKNSTADFGIRGNQVWLDSDSGYHPCKIDGDILIFDLGPEVGLVRNKIISLKGDVMVLESEATKQRATLTRAKK